MSAAIISQWLHRFVATAVDGDLDGHMALISPEVMVFGVPGFDTLGRDDWRTQCAHEFPQRLIRAMDYSEPQVRVADDKRILFKSLERIHTADCQVIAQAVEMLLQHTGDGWLLQQMRLLPDDEARHDGLV